MAWQGRTGRQSWNSMVCTGQDWNVWGEIVEKQTEGRWFQCSWECFRGEMNLLLAQQRWVLQMELAACWNFWELIFQEFGDCIGDVVSHSFSTRKPGVLKYPSFALILSFRVWAQQQNWLFWLTALLLWQWDVTQVLFFFPLSKGQWNKRQKLVIFPEFLELSSLAIYAKSSLWQDKLSLDSYNSDFSHVSCVSQTVVRGSTVEVEGYISGLLNDIQKLSAISSNTLRGRSPTSRRRAQSLGLLGDERPPDMYLQSPEGDWADKYGNYLNCNGGSKVARRQTMWPDYKSRLEGQSHPNGMVTKAQSLGPSEFQGTDGSCLQRTSGLQHVPAVPGESEMAMKSPEEGWLQQQPNARPSGEGSPSSKSRENSLKRRLLRSVFPSSSTSNKPGPPLQIKVRVIHWTEMLTLQFQRLHTQPI